MDPQEIIAEVAKLTPTERDEVLAAVRDLVFQGDEKLPEAATGESERDVWDVLQKFAGTMPELPEDMSVNHDHYLYGTPKKKP